MPPLEIAGAIDMQHFDSQIFADLPQVQLSRPDFLQRARKLGDCFPRQSPLEYVNDQFFTRVSAFK